MRPFTRRSQQRSGRSTHPLSQHPARVPPSQQRTAPGTLARAAGWVQAPEAGPPAAARPAAAGGGEGGVAGAGCRSGGGGGGVPHHAAAAPHPFSTHTHHVELTQVHKALPAGVVQLKHSSAVEVQALLGDDGAAARVLGQPARLRQGRRHTPIRCSTGCQEPHQLRSEPHPGAPTHAPHPAPCHSAPASTRRPHSAA